MSISVLKMINVANPRSLRNALGFEGESVRSGAHMFPLSSSGLKKQLLSCQGATRRSGET